MAAALTTNGLLKTHRHHHPLFYFRKRSNKPLLELPPAKNTFSERPLAHPKNSFSAPNVIPSSFSVMGSSSSSKFGLVSWYLGMVNTRPISTKSITSAFIYMAADLSSQTIVRENEGYDLVRTLRTAGYGMLIIGPSLHYWFNFMSRLYPKLNLFSTFKKMAFGQMVYGPVVTAIYFSVNAALQGESGAEIVSRLKRDLIPTLISGIMYWPVCDFLTFKFIPVHLQPLVSNSFSYLWTVYLTYIASLEKVSTN